MERPQTLAEMLERGKNLSADERAERKREQNAQLAEENRVQDQARRLKICRKLSEIGERFAQRTFDTFEVADGNAAALIAAREVAADPALGAYLWSPIPGNGKSHLAGAIVNDCIGRGVEAVFITGVKLLMRIRDTYTNRGNVRDGELDIIERLERVTVLALDDLGTEPFTEHTARLFYALINGRYEGNRAMVVTSNKSLADLGMKWISSGVEEHLGAKLVDRLREMCTYKVEITEKSHRGVRA